MRKFIWMLVLGVAVIASCTRSASHQNGLLDDAERIVPNSPDSAFTMIEGVEPSDLAEDSLKAKFYYVMAFAHKAQNRSMVSDSLIHCSYEYYKGRDIAKSVESGTLYAWHKFWVGDTEGAVRLLDSLTASSGIPDSVVVEPLRMRALLGASLYEGEKNVAILKRLQRIDKSPKAQLEYKYLLCEAYEYAGKCDSALMLIDELIAFAKANKIGDKQFQFEMDRAQILTELGRYGESDHAIDEVFRKAPDNGAAHYLYLQKAMNHFNRGDLAGAASELDIADSMASEKEQSENAYFQSFSRLLRTMIDYRKSRKLSVKHIAGVTNRQQERFNRMAASQWETERNALRNENTTLVLKAKNEQKAAVLIILILALLLTMGISVWVVHDRRLKVVEAEERAEALQKMVDELKEAPESPSGSNSSDALRRAMLRQLGIIKMVAETPTEQNREMLRKISSLDGETNGALVNWDNIFAVIDNLYSGFHTKLIARFGDMLTLKETQIIVLMVAGFSTKEIGVITSQTTATIYVRKSSVRKKLGVPEKEDIVAFLHQTLAH